jgi:hypothetical protein
MRTDGIRAHYGPGQTTVIRCSHKTAASSFLGRYAKKKPLDGSNVAMQQFPKPYPRRRATAPSKALEIHCSLFPARCTRIRYRAQINPLDQDAVGTPQSTNHNFQPVCHKPGGYPAVRFNVLCRREKTFHASLPVEKTMKQCANHGRCRVQHIRDQLVRKQGKGHILLATQKSGDWNPFFPENRENVDDIAFVMGNLPVTLVVAADRTCRPNYLRKNNLALDKRFFIFPDTLECVNKGKLYRFTALSSRRQVFGSETYGPASLRRVVIFLRSISYLDNLPSFISSVILLCKNYSSQFGYNVSNNRGPANKRIERTPRALS